MTQRTTTSPEASPTKGTDAEKLQNSESEDEGSKKAPSQRFTKLKKLKVTVQDEESSDGKIIGMTMTMMESMERDPVWRI